MVSGWKTLVDYFKWNVAMESGPKQRIYDHEEAEKERN